MKKILTILTLTASLFSTSTIADTIKVGVIAPFSGPYAIYGKQYQEAIEVYVSQNGSKSGEYEIEFIYKDVGGISPDKSKSLAQELIIRDQVDYLAGFTFTPNALAVASLIQKSKTPTVIFNAATSVINQKSDYFSRTSFTLWQVSSPLAQWAYGQGIRTVVISVADYGPGLDAENAFKSRFEELGGKILDSIHMPLSTTDFTPFIQSIKDKQPDALFAFIPAGPPTFAYTKAYSENGLNEVGIKFLGTGETEEVNLQALGDAAIGLNTAYHYSSDHDSELNHAFLAKLEELHPGSIANFASVGAYDGTHLIYEMVKNAGKDSAAAMESIKGFAWESPRGAVMIDPETRHILQNVYIRRVEKNSDGLLVNKEFKSYDLIPDLGTK